MASPRRTALALLTLVPLVACGPPVGGGGTPERPAPATVAPRDPVTVPGCDRDRVPPLERTAFSDSTRIDNKWLPMIPGTRFVLAGEADRGSGSRPHKVTFTVTDLQKEIDGIPTVVVWDVDTNQGDVVESELAFFAQDVDGNVWLFGEYPEEYEDGKLVGAPSTWLAGTKGADAGVILTADARPGTGEFLQGNAPDVDFLDCARDKPGGGRVCVPADCYDGVRVVDERSPLEPESGFQRKIYAAGAGNVKVEPIDDPEGETLVLVERRTLSAAQLAEARQEALKLDKRAYRVAKAYRGTPKARTP